MTPEQRKAFLDASPEGEKTPHAALDMAEYGLTVLYKLAKAEQSDYRDPIYNILQKVKEAKKCLKT